MEEKVKTREFLSREIRHSAEYRALNDDRDRVLFLRFEKSYPPKFIAEVTKVPYGTVRRWIARPNTRSNVGRQPYLTPQEETLLVGLACAKASEFVPLSEAGLIDEVSL